MMTHVFIANIFLMNYLIAILSAVYNIMIEEGEFSYKKKKYQFIEKYSIPLRDQFGYAELVIHPPPVNAFLFILLPFSIRKGSMKVMGECFSKLIFWVENFFYILGFFIYEISLVPLIYFRVLYNIIRVSGIVMLFPLVLIWFATGLFVLLFGVFKDTFYFVMILCNYQIKQDRTREKE